MDVKERALQAHEKWGGKIEVVARCEVNSKDDLSIAYTPGVAEPCLKIKDDPSLSYTYTRRHNLVAVITDGTAVLGLGDIGPIAGMPVMEGKCALFKAFADVDAFPLCVASKDVDEIVRTIQLISGSFGGINLEDIAAPRCFEIERRLKEVCDIPVFHDDQHGTAVCCGAALLNACRLTGRKVDLVGREFVAFGGKRHGIVAVDHVVGGDLRRIGLDRHGDLLPGRLGQTRFDRLGITGRIALDQQIVGEDGRSDIELVIETMLLDILVLAAGENDCGERRENQ